MDSSGDDDDDDDENPANLSSSNEVYIVLTQYSIWFINFLFLGHFLRRDPKIEENSANQLVNRIHFLLKKANFFFG